MPPDGTFRAISMVCTHILGATSGGWLIGATTFDWVADPRSAVLLVLLGIALIGGGLKAIEILRINRTRRMLQDPTAAPEVISTAGQFGRAALPDLFRILSTTDHPAQRQAAGETLATLWGQDQLIPEEEKVVLTRGFEVNWICRRRYPRDLTQPITVTVRFGVPFLTEDGPGIRPRDLEWSHRIAGSRRATLEMYSPWTAGNQSHTFTIVPGDFSGRGPHHLRLEARARVPHPTSPWQLDLPQVPLAIEFDPDLKLDALMAAPDEQSGSVLANSLRLEAAESNSAQPAFLFLSDQLAVADPPHIAVDLPLPCDLAHRIWLEFENPAARLVMGTLIMSGQGGQSSSQRHLVALGPLASSDSCPVDRPGEYRIRVVLEPDAELAWAAPGIRSLWPGPVSTPWRDVRIVRR